MKCTIAKNVLQGMLAKVQGFTERKSTLPILSHVLLELKDGEMQIKATDLHTSIQVTRECSVNSKGACAVNAKSFLEIIKELPSEDVALWSEDGTKLHIEVGNYKSTLNIMDPEEYPSIDFKDLNSGTSIDPDIMKYMIDRTIFSIPVPDEDDTQYTLGGALLTTGEEDGVKYIEMVTTDSRRLSLARHRLDSELDMGDGIVVPRKGVHELKRLMEGNDESAGIQLTSDSIYYVSADTVATVRLIDGRFPDYRGVVDLDSYAVTTTISSFELLNALKVCSAMMSDVSNCVKFFFKDGKALLYAHNPDQGDAETVVESSHMGDEIEANFNPRYFMDCLAHIDGDVDIRLKATQGPCLVTPAGSVDSKWVIMPMRF